MALVTMEDSFCTNLSSIFSEIEKKTFLALDNCIEGISNLAMEGPAFSTKAGLAKESDMAYSSLSMFTNYDCWHQTHQKVSAELVLDNLRSNTEVANKIIFEVAKLIKKERPKNMSHFSLKDGNIIQKKISQFQLERNQGYLLILIWIIRFK